MVVAWPTEVLRQEKQLAKLQQEVEVAWPTEVLRQEKRLAKLRREVVEISLLEHHHHREVLESIKIVFRLVSCLPP